MLVELNEDDLDTTSYDCEHCRDTGYEIIDVTNQFGELVNSKKVKCSLCTEEEDNDDFIDDDSDYN